MFLGRDFGHQANYSDEVATRIDSRDPRARRRAPTSEARGHPHRPPGDARHAGRPPDREGDARPGRPGRDPRRAPVVDRTSATPTCRQPAAMVAAPAPSAAAAAAVAAQPARARSRRPGPGSPSPRPPDRPPDVAGRRRAGRRGDRASCSPPSARIPAATACSGRPTRVAEMYAEILAGLDEDPARHLDVTFDGSHDEMIMERDIPIAVAVRAPPAPVHRAGPRRLHPRRRRPHHRAVQAGPPGRRLQPAAPGPGAPDHPDRRHPPGGARAPRACWW